MLVPSGVVSEMTEPNSRSRPYLPDELCHEKHCLTTINRQLLEGLVAILNREVDEVEQLFVFHWHLCTALRQQVKQKVEVMCFGIHDPQPAQPCFACLLAGLLSVEAEDFIRE